MLFFSRETRLRMGPMYHTPNPETANPLTPDGPQVPLAYNGPLRFNPQPQTATPTGPAYVCIRVACTILRVPRSNV